MNGRFRLATDSRVFVLLLGALTALPPLSIDASLPAFPATARAFAVAPGALGATLGAFMIAFALGQLIWGPLSDQYGRRPTILIGLALYACAGFACAFARDAPELIAARFAQGLTACASTVGARAMIRDIFTERRQAAQMQGYVAAAMASRRSSRRYSAPRSCAWRIGAPSTRCSRPPASSWRRSPTPA